MAGLKLVYKAVIGEFDQAMKEKYRPIAKASTAAITAAADLAKANGRASIAAAGFSKGWQNALRSHVYPGRGRVSANAAAFLFHKIPYADVFETGAVIRGKPLLWMPLDSAPKRIGRKRITPELYEKNIGPLDYVKRPGGKPLLVAKVRTTTKRLAKARPSVRMLRRGRAGKRGTIQSVPIFVGLPTVTIRRRFHVTEAAEAARDALPGLYYKNFQGD